MEAQDIFLGDTETGTILRRLTHDPGIDTAPSFSPSGESFVFVSDRLGSPPIFVMQTGEKRAHRISWAGAYNSAPAWSPDGRSIAWSRRRGGTRNQIMIADVESPRSSARVLLRGAASFETPSFSPDGRYVVAARRERHDSYPVLYNIRTERLMPLARVELPGPCHQPTWSGVPR
jgi:TolB protein